METIDFKVIHTPLKAITQTMIEQLQREPRNKIEENLPLICELFLRVADNNYDAVRCLVVNDYKFSPTAKIICRSTLDMVYTLCLLMSNPQKYVILYMKSGWREKFEELLLEKESDYMKTHGIDWLKEYEALVESSAEIIGLTNDERENFNKTLIYFPTAPQMINPRNKYYRDFNELTKVFLEKLMQEYYGKLSQVLHVSDPGLAIHASPLIEDFSRHEEVLKSEPVAISMMANLILLSEINMGFEYRHGAKLKEIWTYLSMTIPLHNELYAIKYKKVL